MKDFYFENDSRAVVRGIGVFCTLTQDCTSLDAALVTGADSNSSVTSFDASLFLTDQASAFWPAVNVALLGDGAKVTLAGSGTVATHGARVFGKLRGWATRQDPLDLSVLRSGEALHRAISVALDKAMAFLDTGLAPIRRAVKFAVAALFGASLSPSSHPETVFGLAPSSGASMTLAAGDDATGDAFAFVIEGPPQ